MLAVGTPLQVVRLLLRV